MSTGNQDSQVSTKYHLPAIVEHLGNIAYFGHYSSYLRSAPETWHNFDDAQGDCWAEIARDNKGPLMPRKSTLPSSIKAQADYVHSKGLKLRIYTDSGKFCCGNNKSLNQGHELGYTGIGYTRATHVLCGLVIG